MKRIWFWLALAASCALAYFSYTFLPELALMATDAPIAPGYLEILQNSLLVQLAGQVALLAIFFSALGLVLPAIVEAIALAKAKARIESLPLENHSPEHTLAVEFETELKILPLMAETIPAYAKFLMEKDNKGKSSDATTTAGRGSTLRAFISAHHFFGPQIYVEEHLTAWLFRPLASVLQGYGLIAFIIAGLLGFHEYRDALTMGNPEASALLWAWVEKGLFALTFASIGALIILLFTKTVFGLRKKQVNGFCRYLDQRYNFVPPSAMLGEVVMSSERENQEARKKMQEQLAELAKSLQDSQRDLARELSRVAETIAGKTGQAIEISLRGPLEKLADISKKMASDQSLLATETITAALKTFRADMDKDLGGQFKKTNAVLKSTASLSTRLEKSFADAVNHLAKMNGEQHQSFATVIKEINATLSNLKNFEKSLQQIAATVTPALDRVMENQTALMTALGDEKSAGKIIGQAAQDMNKAAKASKDTVESFITLAENMKEASRLIGSGGKSTVGDGSQAAPQGRTAGKPAKQATEGAGNLSRALRDLKDKAGSTAKLPKL